MKFNLVSRKYSWDVDHTYDGVDGEYGQNHDTNDDISTISGGGVPPAYAKDASVLLETAHEKKLRKRSHWVAYATMFVMTVGFSVVLSGVWPYLKILSPGIQKQSLGWVVAANPFGQMLASPVVGYIGNRLGSIRYVCYFTMTSFILGHLLYSFLPLVNNLWTNSGYHMMIVARFIVGLSSANVTLCRSYLASSTTVKERTTGIAIVSAAQSLGFVIGPAIQAVLTVSIPNETLKYRTAGWVAASLGVINFILLTPWIFQEYNISAKEHSMLKNADKENSVIPKTDYTALFGVLFGFFVNQFVYVLLETLMEPFLTDQYSWCDNIAVVVSGIIFTFAGILAVIMFIISTRLAKKFDERKILILGAFIPIIIGIFLFIPWGPDTLDYCPRETTTIEPPTSFSTDISIFSSTATPDWNTTSPPTNVTYGKWVEKWCEPGCYGCPYDQTWCIDYYKLPIVQFLFAYVFVICGYPFGVSMSNSIFSKILGPKPQGFWMGILTSSGSLSRVLGPIFVSYLYATRGTRLTFLIILILMILAVIELVFNYKKIVPMKMRKKENDMRN